MSGVADGATTRRERLLEMLDYINSQQPGGPSLVEVQLHMSMTHGLTFKKTLEYVHEHQLAGVLFFEAGHIKIREKNFRRLIEIMAPERENRKII